MTEDNVFVAQCDLGLGLFARRHFKASEFLFSFAGPVIDLNTALAKGDKMGNPLQIEMISTSTSFRLGFL